MTLYNIYGKLRRFNWKNYTNLFFCMILSVVLVTSFALIYFSPTVQMILPAGGDSRKQAVMIFAVAVIGCAIFTMYASTLFFKNKSRETGIFLALGADKNKLERMIFSDILVVTLLGCLSGIVLSFPVSFGIWNLFRLVIVDTREMIYRFGFQGLLIGMVFCLFVALCIFLLGIKFIKRTNIIDIINENRKSEPVRRVKSWYGAAGVSLIAAGIVLGYIVPMIIVEKFYYYLPDVWNAVYGLSFVGVYLLMVYVVVHSEKGKHPERYYKNMISTSMMRFMGKQTVKNMCVTILLVFGALFAIFYVPNIMTGMKENIQKNPFDFSYTYEQRIDQVDQAQLFQMAGDYGIEIQQYQELESIDLITDGTAWGDIVNGKIDIIYKEQLLYGGFYRASDFEKITGSEINLLPGEYAVIQSSQAEQDFDEAGMSIITDPVTQESRKVSLAGNVIFDGDLGGRNSLYVICDQDFDAYQEHLPIENKYKTVFFQVGNWEECYDFAKELKDEIIRRTPKDAAVFRGYDRYMKQEAEKAGEAYFMDTGWPAGENELELSPLNSQLALSWKYYPAFKALQSQDTIKNMAVFFMLFIYIGIICFAAVGIISYTRGITIAMNYKQIFVDLRRLGGNKAYICFCIKSQLKKIFFYPYLVGSALIYICIAMIFKVNDGRILSYEWKALFINLLIAVLIGLYIWGVYRLTYCKFKKIIGLEEKV